MRDEWYVARRGQDGNKRYGPVPLAQLRGLIDQGRVQGEDLVWCEGMTNWQRADRCEELFPPLRPRGGQRDSPAGDRRYGPNRSPRGYDPDDDYRRDRIRHLPQRSSSNGAVIGLVVGGIILGVLVLGCSGLSLIGYLARRSTVYSPAGYGASSKAFIPPDAQEGEDPQDQEVMPNVVLGGAPAQGRMLPFGLSTVYYSANVDAGLAQAVGNYLSNEGDFPADHGTAVQVDRDPVAGTYRVRFFLRDGAAWNPDTFDYYRDLRGELEANPLAGNSVEVELSDPNGNLVRTIRAND